MKENVYTARTKNNKLINCFNVKIELKGKTYFYAPRIANSKKTFSFAFKGCKYCIFLHGKNERSKILVGYRKIILFNYQNNCV